MKLKNTKTCYKCKELKDFSYFYKSNSTGYSSYCKSCNIKNKKIYNKTIDGYITKVYSKQLKSCLKRGHKPPLYSRDELKDWVISQPNFKKLYEDYIDSGYNKDVVPSIDRLDDYKTYSLDNIRLVTFRENYLSAANDAKNGVNNKRNKAIYSIDVNGNRVDYYSTQEAGRKSGAKQSNIVKCLKGNRKTTNNLKWFYANN